GASPRSSNGAPSTGARTTGPATSSSSTTRTRSPSRQAKRIRQSPGIRQRPRARNGAAWSAAAAPSSGAAGGGPDRPGARRREERQPRGRGAGHGREAGEELALDPLRVDRVRQDGAGPDERPQEGEVGDGPVHHRVVERGGQAPEGPRAV